MVIKFWGTRGSVPVPGENTIKYGGNTPCVEVLTQNDDQIVLDGGTGIRSLGKEIVGLKKNRPINILLSHMHWDHIHGFLFFDPLYEDEYTINIFSNLSYKNETEEIFDVQMHPSFFPVKKDDAVKAKVVFNHLISGNKFNIGTTEIETIELNHSKGTLAFKITENGKSVVYMTDNEIVSVMENLNLETIRINNSKLIEFVEGADYLIHDSMFNLEDYNTHVGWGHSNNISLAYFAMAAKIKNLVLFHYEPNYSDTDVDVLLDEVKNIVEKNNSDLNVIASREGAEIEVR